MIRRTLKIINRCIYYIDEECVSEKCTIQNSYKIIFGTRVAHFNHSLRPFDSQNYFRGAM